MDIQYPLLLISNIRTLSVKFNIEKQMPDADTNKKVSIYIDTDDGIVYWADAGLTNKFLMLLSSYGIEYTYYESKGNPMELDKSELIDYNSMKLRINELNTEFGSEKYD